LNPTAGTRGTLKIAVTNGWPDHLDIVTLSFDGAGSPTGGSGGNYSRYSAMNNAGFVSKPEVFSPHRLDVVNAASPEILIQL